MLLLQGCGNGGPEARYDDYLGRLGRTLEVEPESWEAALLPPLPRTGRLRIALEGSSVDTLDFLALRGCALQVTIGKRNSSLGRMASDSQRLLLELEYLQLAPDCVETLRERGRDGLADELESAWRRKRDQLPALVFNATLANREYRALWRRPAVLGDYPEATGSGVIVALEAVNREVRRWLAGDYRFDNAGFELLLSEVAPGDGGALGAALGLQAAALGAADSMLRRRMARGPLCTGGLRPEAVEILDNVVRKFFVGGIQPWSAAVERRRQQLLPPLRELERLLDAALPAAYRSWAAERDRLLADWAGAPRRHVEHIQRLQAPCRETG